MSATDEQFKALKEAFEAIEGLSDVEKRKVWLLLSAKDYNQVRALVWGYDPAKVLRELLTQAGQAGPSGTGEEVVLHAGFKKMQAGLQAGLQALEAGMETLRVEFRALNVKHVQLTASEGGRSNNWREANAILSGKFDMTLKWLPCCFGSLTLSNNTIPPFVWNPPNSENDTRNVNKVIEFLQGYVLPEGVSVVALHALEWLTASIDCGGTGSLTIANSKTGYVFLLESGRQLLKQWPTERANSGVVTADMIKLLLPYIVGLFETKTTKSLLDGTEGPMHQAVLEYLAVNKLRAETSDKIPVLMGDCNMWGCIHIGAKDNEIHQMWPQATLPTVHEESVAKEAKGSVSGNLMKAIISKARDDRRRGLLVTEAGGRGNGGDGGVGGSQGGSGQGGGGDSGGRRGDSGGSVNGKRGGNDCCQGGGSDPDKGGGGEEAGESSLSHQCGGGHGAGNTCRDSDASSNGSGAPDEGVEEAAWDHAYTQQMYAELQRPEVYQSLGLSQPPKWFTPPDLERYAQSMCIVGISDVRMECAQSGGK